MITLNESARSILRCGFRAALCLLFSALAAAQTTAHLKNADTTITLEASANAPRLSRLEGANIIWQNLSAETLIANAEVSGQRIKLDWRLNSEQSHASERSANFVYENSNPHLRLEWQWEIRNDHGPIEHQVRIENLDSHELWLPLQNSFTFDWQVPPADHLEHFYVEKGADSPSANGTHRTPLPASYKWEGKSSTYAQPRLGENREIIPFFLVERSDQDQSGWYVGIEFSGRVHLTLVRELTLLHGELGLDPNPAPFRTRLSPGEIFETPRIFIGTSRGGPDATGNILRRWVREVLTDADTWKDPRYPLTVNNSWGGGMKVNEEIAKRMIRDAADLGLEMFHVDAGWFRAVGDWYPDPKKFPHGLGPIADEAHAAGMKFGLWVDWAQAGLATSASALSVRDPKVRGWLPNDLPNDWKPEDFKGQTIDIGVPEAKAWAMQETDRIVTDYKLDMLEHDGYLVAKGCEANNHPHAPPDLLNRCTYKDAGFVFVESSNSTDVSYHAARAYYGVQSTLRRKHPGLLLEICNDGGRMVDFGSAAHGDYFSITDTYDPLSNRRAFYDTSFVLPPAMLEAYVEKFPAPKIENFLYVLRSGMMGWLSIMIDTSTWTAEQHQAAKNEIQFYKSYLRPLIRDADLYHISERPDGVHWDGIEYLDRRTGRGVVYAFHGSDPKETVHAFSLQRLNPRARYEVHFRDQPSHDEVILGKTLMQSGLKLSLPQNSSAIVTLKELTARQ